MKRFTPLFLIYLLIVSCKSKTERTGSSNDSIPAESQISDTVASDTKPQNAPMCFLSSVSKDSTSVRLQIDGDKVTGELYWLPYQKDSARGTLKGTKNAAGEFDLMYQYMIEGNQQTETKIMIVQNETLWIKKDELLDPKNDGNLVFKDAAQAKYQESIPAADCKTLIE